MAENKEAKVVKVTESIEEVFVKATVTKEGDLQVNSNISEIAMLNIMSSAMTMVTDKMLVKQEEPSGPVQ